MAVLEKRLIVTSTITPDDVDSVGRRLISRDAADFPDELQTFISCSDMNSRIPARTCSRNYFLTRVLRL